MGYNACLYGTSFADSQFDSKLFSYMRRKFILDTWNFVKGTQFYESIISDYLRMT